MPPRPAPVLLCASLAFAATALAGPMRKAPYEPPFPKAAGVTGAENLLLNAKVTASGHWSDKAPGRAVNGNADEEDHWACEGLPAWLSADLGARKTLSAVRVKPYRADGRVYKFKVEGSNDGSSWFVLADHTANSITAPEDGFLLSFPPRDARHVRVTFTGNSRGAANGAHLVEFEAYGKIPDKALVALVGSTDERYAPTGPVTGAPAASGLALRAWRGERANGQLVLAAPTAQPETSVSCAGLRGPGGKVLPVSLNFVRYVRAAGKVVPDILDTEATLDLAAGTNRPVWIAVDVPRDAAPGRYLGEVLVRSAAGTAKVPLMTEVLPATLPEPRDWKVHVDLWQHPDAVARYHDVPMWSPEHFALMKPLMRRLADAGQKTITCTLINEAWGGQTYDKFRGMIEWRRKADGTWRYDYSVFDRWVEFMQQECGFENARIHCYTMIPWSLKFAYLDEARGVHDELALKPGSPEYEKHWGAFLKDFTAHLRSKGWLEKTRIGIDERPDHLLRPTLALIATHAPELKLASAIDHPSALTREIDDISPGIGTSGEFTPEMLEARRKEGKRTTFYVCTNPPTPNNFTFSPPAESEWLGLFASARGFDGFLRWAYNSWVENPLDSTDFTSWPSGDCFLVYPGNRSSIRFERLRDGLEDFEKVRLLRDAAAKNSSGAAKAAMTKVDETLKVFTWPRGSKSGLHAADVKAATDAIDAAALVLRP